MSWGMRNGNFVSTLNLTTTPATVNNRLSAGLPSPSPDNPLNPAGTLLQSQCEDPCASTVAERFRTAETDRGGVQLDGIELESGRDRGKVGSVTEELHR